jgi:hypothetical protein
LIDLYLAEARQRPQLNEAADALLVLRPSVTPVRRTALRAA